MQIFRIYLGLTFIPFLRDLWISLEVWRVDDERYASRLKYSLIFLEYKTGKKILMDNHFPKRPRTHIDDQEFTYEFINIVTLLKDFRNLVLKHFGEKI